ncbi:hypothetical protein JDV09_08845 [Mycobacterium sp. Y57]|uniref:hypothetical protein n=1 Tax=Mycolicibacterium xanthum TaxID=2796469 RepID=UPI001C855F01|nr:hypothetical protein [Mycolicibacterium xanthum]MBX7432215.1 hypothetical protein [Mycolicibacterium xanthum]
MATVENFLDGSATTKESATAFIEDPLAFFDMSLTKMQSVPRDVLQELQAEALSMRFEQQKDRIPTLSKLADRQGITRVGEIDEVHPLLFEHTIYKSYPTYLLEKGQFDKLTIWLNRLTPHDLSGVDATHCDSIDSWLDLLCAETDLDPITSSGTTGTMSFTPRDKSDWRTFILGGFRVQLLQRFGEPPSDADLNEPIHVCWPSFPDGHTPFFRAPHYFHEYFALGSDDYFHPMFDTPGDTDVMFLAARLRAAQARGDSRVDVPQRLLDRRDELATMEAERPARAEAWTDILASKMSGKRVFLMSPAQLIYDVAKMGLDAGKKCDFAPDSFVSAGLGGKGFAMPDNWLDVVEEFLNFDGEFGYFYGFSEQTGVSVRCEHGRCHLPPWLIPLILDPETSELLPREGAHVGRAAFFDLAINGVWGGLITGDKVEIDWNPCPCGRTTTHISDEINRFSVEQGGTDKISCTATPEAHADAMDFLTSF